MCTEFNAVNQRLSLMNVQKISLLGDAVFMKNSILKTFYIVDHLHPYRYVGSNARK